MRTSVVEVKKLIETELSDTIVEAFIKSANIFVTNNLGDSDLDSATLEDIEKWVAAHFLTVRERQAKSEGAGGASITYFGKDGEGLKASLYGQQAIALDSSGTLLAIAEQKKPLRIISLNN